MGGHGVKVGGQPELGCTYVYIPIGLFRVAKSPRSTCHRPRQVWRA